METSNSETPEGQKDEQRKERRIQELEDQIAKLKEQLNAANDKKSLLTQPLLQQEGEFVKSEQAVEELGPVHETEEEEIEQVTRKFNKANITIDQLESDNQRLREEKYAAELARAKLEEEKDIEIKRLKQIIYELKCKLNLKKERLRGAPQKSRQDSERKGHLCNKDCVLCCLLWICNNKLDVYPCGPHLRTIITLEADRSAPIIENKYLRCEAFMSILVKYKVVDIYPKQDPKRPEMDDIHDRYCNKDKAWEKIMGVDKKERAVIIGNLISKAGEVGHCVVCDLETDAREKGSLTIHDPQSEEGGTVNQDAFEGRVKDDDGVVVFTVKFKKLKRIIDEHEKSLMHIPSEDCKTNLTGTDNNRMSPVSPTVTESPEEPKIIELPAESTVTESPAESTVTKLPAESTVTELPVEPNMQPAAQDMFPAEP